MAQLQVSAKEFNDLTFVRLARELALAILPLETILSNNQVPMEVWEQIQVHPRFLQLLEIETANWGSALNTHERVKLKSAALIEEWLPEAYARMTDPTENLNAKSEVAKLVAKLAGMGLSTAAVGGEGGERFSVTINLGSDNRLTFEKTVTPKVIDAEMVD